MSRGHSISLIRKLSCVLVLLVIMDLCVQPSCGLPAGFERILRRAKRQNGGGYDAQRQDLGYGEGYGYSGYSEYCDDCAHCNGCGHQPNRRVLIEFDYVPK